MNYLAFDLGGSSGKLSLARFENGIIQMEKVHAFPNRPVSISGHLCWDICAIYEELCKGIQKAAALTDNRIDGIGFDSFCNDFALIGTDGQLLAPVGCYRDEKTARCQAHTYSIMPPEDLYRINGNQIALFNTLLQLDAMRQEGQGDLLDQAKHLLFVSDLFTWLLTGVPVTEYTTASVTQMYDYGEDNWSDQILRAFDIRKDLFTPLVKPGTVVGMTSESFCKKNGTKAFPVTAVCQHDTASAFLGSVGDGDCAIISTGTWCLVGVETERPVITKEGYAANVANEGGYAGHHRLLRNVMGTWILQEFLREAKNNGTDYTFEELDRMAAQSLKNASPEEWIWFDVDAPAFFRPGNMSEKIDQGCLKACGRRPADTGELVCAVYISLALKYRYTIELLERMTGRAIASVNMIGGGSRSRLMCRITADVCGRPVTAGPADAAACGNVLVQMLSGGVISSVEEGRGLLRESISVSVYDPQDKVLWDSRYQIVKENGFCNKSSEKGGTG